MFLDFANSLVRERGISSLKEGTGMKLNRRMFLASTGFPALLGFLGIDLSGTKAFASGIDHKRGRITTTICPYCGVGCGAIVTSSNGKIVNVEGDPDHPINEGTLCSKGNALYQVAGNNERRLTKVKYRAANSQSWEDLDWNKAVDMIAERIKKTRDENFTVRDDQQRLVNRTDAIACIGGAALDNEECYAYSKFARSLGAVYIEHQARI
jgi:formate dehydrogenase major subunit